MRHCFGFNARVVLECKADSLQPVNDITGKPTLIASLYLTLHAVSKVFEAFMFLFFMIVVLPLNTKRLVYVSNRVIYLIYNYYRYQMDLEFEKNQRYMKNILSFPVKFQMKS